jgi:hypothetical protein
MAFRRICVIRFDKHISSDIQSRFDTAQRGFEVEHDLLRADDPDRAEGAAGVPGKLASAGRGDYQGAGFGDGVNAADDDVRGGDQPPDVSELVCAVHGGARSRRVAGRTHRSRRDRSGRPGHPPSVKMASPEDRAPGFATVGGYVKRGFDLRKQVDARD